MLHPLSERQTDIITYVRNFIRVRNHPPTICEIQSNLNIKNPGAIHKAFCALEKKGYLVRKKGQHRGLDLTQEAKEHFQ
jgi:repressor LexA